MYAFPLLKLKASCQEQEASCLISAADAFSALARLCLSTSLAMPAENSKGGLAHKALQIASARASDDEGIRC